MAIKHGSKVDKSFSSASMTDLMFLLLLFLLIATTLINPNALNLTLPKSSNVIKEKAQTTVSIQYANGGFRYYVELEEMSDLTALERELKSRLGDNKDAVISLHCDQGVTVEEAAKIMNIAAKGNYNLILATSAN